MAEKIVLAMALRKELSVLCDLEDPCGFISQGKEFDIISCAMDFKHVSGI